MTYVKGILVGLDQLGNAIAGGNPDCTISGRTGNFALNSHNSVRWYWLILQYVIDATFYPFDGKGHCYQAYMKEQDEEYYVVGGVGLFALSLITLASCLTLISPFYIIFLIKLLFKKR